MFWIFLRPGCDRLREVSDYSPLSCREPARLPALRSLVVVRRDPRSRVRPLARRSRVALLARRRGPPEHP